MGLKQRIKKRNFEDVRIVRLLSKFSKKGSDFWKSVAERLSTPRSNRVMVNVGKLDRLASDDFVLVVPGKVLGTGIVLNKITVSAYSFSQTAVEKIEKAGGKVLTLEELFEKNSKGQKVKMVI